MAKEKPTFVHKFDVGEAIGTPWSLPGGRNFLARIILWGTGIILVVYALFGKKFISSYADFIIMASELERAGNQADPTAAMEMMSGAWALMGSVFLIALLAWVVMITIETAMHKNLFYGTDHGVFPLRFGKDELRVLLAQLVIFIIGTVVYLAGLFLLSLLVVGIVASAQSSGGLAAVMGIAVFFGFIAYLAFLIIMMIRWAPAASMSVRDNKQRLFEGRGITKGRSWPLFGTYLVTFLIGYIGIYAIMIIGGVIAFGNMDFLSLFMSTSDDPAAIMAEMGEAIKTPRVMVPLVIFTILYALATVLWYVHVWGIGAYMTKLDAKETG